MIQEDLLKNTNDRGARLYQLIDYSSFDPQKLNMIEAPCGSGKTTFVLEHLINDYCDPRRSVYLIDTVAGMEKLLKHENCRRYNRDFMDAVEYFLWDPDKKITVMTYALFGTLCTHYEGWFENLDTIVCDEMHKLVEMMKWEESSDTEHSQKAWDVLMTCIASEHLPSIIAMSATPNAVYRKMGAKPKQNPTTGKVQYAHPQLNIVPLTGKPMRYNVRQVIPYNNLTMLCNELPLDKKGIIYASQISVINRCADLLCARGLRVMGIWSTHNTTHKLTAEQKRVRTSVIQNEAIPDNIDVLLINKSFETCLNIKSHIDYMVIHTTHNDTKIQARGRFRDDLDTLYIHRPDLPCQIALPPDMLDIPLFKEDIDAYIKRNNIRTEKGSLMKSPSFISLLADQGYKVTPGKKRKGKRYHTISAPITST